MILPKILNAGVYRHAQKSSQTVHAVHLGLSIRGAVRSTVYFPDGTLCRSDNGDEYRAVSDKVEAVAVEGHLALFAVRGEDGKLHVYANYKNRRRDTEIAGGIAALAA